MWLLHIIPLCHVNGFHVVSYDCRSHATTSPSMWAMTRTDRPQVLCYRNRMHRIVPGSAKAHRADVRLVLTDRHTPCNIVRAVVYHGVLKAMCTRSSMLRYQKHC